MWDQILELPAIVQGALGSALFAIVLWCLKRVGTVVFEKMTFLDRKMKIHNINAQLLRCKALQNGEPSMITFALIGLIYLALANVLKAIICLLVGYILSSRMDIFTDISVMFSLYFLLQALVCVSDNKDGPDYDKKIEELESKLKELEVVHK
ncbi:TPA: hypothetical protein ACX3GK_002998 [Vibrio parahaemolyticus]|uniref:DUF2721 domain-containing protein n=2 Tax=Vibrio harveyi group TaxID=717610 RepID=A0ABM6S755_9VIBR|nr:MULTISPECIES: hypothetical protein [Vibrio]EJG0664858.1 hypothetical protein [Vibrio parahaemolyticus]HAS6235782.1 hypothetical protein [Vibrio vulnificus]ASO31006.1 hypothetical protein CG015_17565 [Vibrio anguillarum]AVH25792.1 hypothetical protein AL468_00350 [Vibrio diabolicus]ELA7626377.1 hypothetical protein [Vibrio parahaemolyticus]